MRRLIQIVCALGLVGLPQAAQAQYGMPAYYYPYPRPMPVYAPSYGYGWQAGPASYPRYYPQANWSVQPAQYPVANSYPAAAPMPAPPPVYYTYSSPAPPAPVSSAQPVPSHGPTGLPAVSIPPLSQPMPSDSDASAETRPESVIHHKGKNAPEVIHIQPPSSSEPVAPTLPQPCTNCKSGKVIETAPTSCAADGTCPVEARKKCRFMLFGDALYMTVRGADVPYAQSFDGVGPLAVPRGPVAVADPDYQPAFRVGGGVGVGESSWVVATFSFFESDTRDVFFPLTGPVPTATTALTVFPATVNAAFTPLSATARYDVDLITGDIDYKALLCSSECATVTYLLGGRYGQLDQAFNATYPILGTTTVDSDISFDGFGPRAGIEGEYRAKCGLFGYGKGVFNLLLGHFDATYVQRNVFTGLQAQTEVGDDRLVPVLEFEAGLGWVSRKGHLRVSGGYYVAAWFNTLTTNSLVQGIRATNFTTNGDNFRDTLTFDGLVGRIEVRY
jgi:hypothetical protein